MKNKDEMLNHPTPDPGHDRTSPRPGTQSFLGFLAMVLTAPFKSWGVLCAFLFSIAGIVVSHWAWPALNNTDWYLLLYLVDFVMYFAFILFAGLTARWCLTSTGQGPIPSAFPFLLLVAVSSLFPLIMDDVRAGITDRTQVMWFSLALKFPTLLAFTLFIVFAVSPTKPLTTLFNGTILFLKNFHWVLLVSLVLALLEIPFSYAFLLWPGMTVDQFRLFSDLKTIFISYLSDLAQIALVLTLLSRRAPHSRLTGP